MRSMYRALHGQMAGMRKEIADALRSLPPAPLGSAQRQPGGAEVKQQDPSLLDSLAARLGSAGQVDAAHNGAGDGDGVEDDAASVLSRPVLASQSLLTQMLAKARPFGSFVSFVKLVDWKTPRNKREAEVLGAIIDAHFRAGGSPTAELLEIALLRLAGVQAADSTGDWEVCEAVQVASSSQLLLPRAELDRAMRSAVQRRKLAESVGRRSSFDPPKGDTRGRSDQRSNNHSASARHARATNNIVSSAPAAPPAKRHGAAPSP
jgi:hypothetical protein